MTARIPVWAMLATPFTADGAEVDHVSLRHYAREVIRRGCSAGVVLGVIGEPTSLTPDERIAVVETVIGAGVEVHVAALGASHDERVAEVAGVARRFGQRVAGFLVPVSTGDHADLRREIVELSGVGRSPLVVQDYPSSSGVSIGVEDLARAVTGLPEVLAIKCEAPATFDRIRRLRRLLPDVRLMSGLGGLSLVDDLAQGASMVASGTSRPELAVAAVQAWAEGDDLAARRLVAVAAAGAAFEIQQGTSIAIRKEHWRRQGVIASAAVRPPTAPYESYLSALSDAHGFVEAGPR